MDTAMTSQAFIAARDTEGSAVFIRKANIILVATHPEKNGKVIIGVEGGLMFETDDDLATVLNMLDADRRNV